MARGGYRKPNNPAPVSGPGALSKRTDGGPNSKQSMQEIRTGKYGESKALMEQQQGAPMAGNPTPTPRVNAKAAPVADGTSSLFAPTDRPEEPVTAGLPFGPGSQVPPSVPSMISNAGRPQGFELAATLENLLPFDKTGKIKSLYNMAVKNGW